MSSLIYTDHANKSEGREFPFWPDKTYTKKMNHLSYLNELDENLQRNFISKDNTNEMKDCGFYESLALK